MTSKPYVWCANSWEHVNGQWTLKSKCVSCVYFSKCEWSWDVSVLKITRTLEKLNVEVYSHWFFNFPLTRVKQFFIPASSVIFSGTQCNRNNVCKIEYLGIWHFAEFYRVMFEFYSVSGRRASSLTHVLFSCAHCATWRKLRWRLWKFRKNLRIWGEITVIFISILSN